MHFQPVKHPTFQKCHGYSQKSKTIAGKGLQQNFFMRVKSQKLFQWWWNIRRNILINQPISSLNRILKISK